MSEDFREKVREHSQSEQKPLSASLSSQVLEKIKKQGIDPVLTQLFDLDKAQLILINRYDFLCRLVSLHFQTASDAQKPVQDLV